MQFTQNDTLLNCRFDKQLHSEACDEIAPLLKEQITAALEKNPKMIIQFDLADTQLATSAFLRLCVFYKKQVASAGQFYVINMNESVKQVFALSGLLEIMSFTSSGSHFDISG